MDRTNRTTQPQQLIFEQLEPAQIERRSFEIITQELGGRTFDPLEEPVIKRVIHTTADFDYADTLVFSPGVIGQAHRLLTEGANSWVQRYIILSQMRMWRRLPDGMVRRALR